MVRKIVLSIISFCLLLSGCTQATNTATPTFNPTGVLTPYQTNTPTVVVPTTTVVAVIPMTPAPTPTPFLHTLTDDDTMLGIAYKYGITLEELQAANPGVDPHFLSVGKQLIIPINGEIPQVIPTATPVPVKWDDPICHRAGGGGAWCILTVHNDLAACVENLSAWIGLYSSLGEVIVSQTVYAPLNVLCPGGTIPLMAYFKPPLPNENQVQARLLSGINIAKNDPRYLDVELDADPPSISTDGSQARMIGRVVLPDGSSLPSQVWVLAVAYGSDEIIVGSRKWESAGEMEFDLTVYSLGGRIERVELLAEARPSSN